MRATSMIQRLTGLLFLLLLAGALVGGIYWALTPPQPPDVERFAGGNRYETAAATAMGTWPDGVDTVYLATGDDFPDALAAGPVAAPDAALLLVDPEVVPSATVEALDALAPERVVLLGGTGVITDEVADAVASQTGAETGRVAGADRYETAARLAETFEPGVPVVYIVDGTAFADALAAGAAAAEEEGPVLLVDPEFLPDATRAALERLQPEAIHVLGGPSAVSDEVRDELRPFTDGPLLRLRGADRYETAVEVSARAFSSADVVHLASGSAFPDGLAGVVAAGHAGGPLLLSEEECVPEPVLDEVERLGAGRVVLLGGESVLGPDVADLAPCGRAPLF